MATEADTTTAKPMILLVTGVSGSGKTTIGTLLADRLGWTYAEADLFHPEANMAKMAQRIPLDDADRGPWLDAIGDWIDAATEAGTPAVVTCSGLKRAYRDRLRAGRENVRLVYLDVDQETVAARLAERKEHFFPPELLASQFRDLEAPTDGEHVIRVRVDASPEEVVERVLHLVSE
ncbi:MAG TPA: gluconokinase [Actinocrinis sp.]|nr:gluconokinase [Actinocrinis sp.]